MANDSLVIIAREITLLKEKKSLDFADTKRLEILIKMQQLINNSPTEIIKIEEDIYTDNEVLSAIKKTTPKPIKKKVVRKKAPTKKKVTKKATTNGKKKKTTTGAKSGS